MSELYSTIGSMTYDQLLADPQGAEIISIHVSREMEPLPAAQ